MKMMKVAGSRNGNLLVNIKVVVKMVLMVAAMRAMAAALKGVKAQGSTGLEAQFLGPHNAARSKVGVAALAWDANLAAYAANYAARNAGRCQLIHSQGPYGENLFWGGRGRAWTPADAVGAWVDEARYYNYASNTCASGRMCGHYTQMVWRATTRLGCASQICRDGSTFIICSYSPPGNYAGQRPF
ncbi:hypothetical protein L7F22_047607 [Adiantum nelumboides]|nr:hypothetical protein [Adiantum nelumboides]